MNATTLARSPNAPAPRAHDRAGGAGPLTAVEVHPARYGGVGVLRLGERALDLTPIQLAMVQLLLERWRDDADVSALVGGFVPSWELLDRLPWDTMAPDDANLKALVRRLRAKLAGWPLILESRRGFGYRLVAAPACAERAA